MLFLALLLAGGLSGAVSTQDAPDRLRVASWNVLYGFDHGRSIDEGVAWLEERDLHVLALQELNGFTADGLAATAARYGHSHSALQKDHGFAMGLTSTAPIEILERRVEGFHHGYLHARTHGIEFFVVHFWPGKDHEVEHVLARARARLEAGARVAILGDFNTHSHRDASFLAKKRVKPRFEELRSLDEEGFVDVVHRFDRRALVSCPSPITIPKWSKDLEELDAKRQRIDFILLDGELAHRARSATIVRSEALDAISDHYPVVCELGSPPGPSSFRFGVIADCQYCAGPSSGVRLYAESVWKLTACVDHLSTLDLDHVVHLGDFIDKGYESFDVVAPIYDSLPCEHHHVLGNHDYSVADEHKAGVPDRLGMPAPYYDFEAEGWRFVILDGNDVSLHSNPEGTPAHDHALEYHRTRAPGKPTWNGALGQAQLAWLDGVLAAADEAGENVVLYCHFPVFPDNVHNLWNAEEVLARIDAHASVRAFMNGHNHKGNHSVRKGVHYLTLKGMVDTASTSYAVVEVAQGRLVVRGFGREPDRELVLGE